MDPSSLRSMMVAWEAVGVVMGSTEGVGHVMGSDKGASVIRGLPRVQAT